MSVQFTAIFNAIQCIVKPCSAGKYIQEESLFSMAKISRIGHDHPAPFQVVVVVDLFLYQAVLQGENKLLHGQYNSDPQYFYRF